MAPMTLKYEPEKTISEPEVINVFSSFGKLAQVELKGTESALVTFKRTIHALEALHELKFMKITVHQ